MAKSKRTGAIENGSPYKIESGIVITGGSRNAESWKKYPFAEWKVGDSFVIPEDDENGKPHRVAHALSVYNELHKTKMQYASRKQADESRRFWRIK